MNFPIPHVIAATAVPVTHTRDLPPDIADAVLAEAMREPQPPVFTTIEKGVAALHATQKDYDAKRKAHSRADQAQINYKHAGGSDPEERARLEMADRSTEDVWLAAGAHRRAIATAILAIPARSPADILAKSEAHRFAHEVKPGGDYDFKEDAREALNAILADVRSLNEADRALLVLEHEFDRRNALEQLTSTNSSSDKEAEAACQYTGQITKQIMATPAHTVAGWRSKAKVIAWCFGEATPNFSDRGKDYTTSHVYADRFFAGILGGGAPLGPALKPMLSEIQTARADGDAAISRMNNDEDDEIAARRAGDQAGVKAAQAAMEAHCGELAAAEDRIHEAPITDFADAIIKARLAFDHGGHEPSTDLPIGDDFGTAIARKLVLDLAALDRSRAA